jgi:very-short-patch-repair endonuclease
MSDAAIAAIAARQAGAFSAAQATAVGVTPSARRHGVASGRWLVLYRGVLAVAESVDTPERRLWAAKLALGPSAIPSHRSGLWVWEIAATRWLEVVEFSVPPTHSGRQPGIVVHRVKDIAQASVSVRRGITVTNPLRTLVDAGAVLPPDQLEDCVDRAVAKRLVTPPGLLAEVNRLSRCGRTGVGSLRRLLLDQGVGGERSPSYLEAKARRLFRRAGLPEPVVELKWGPAGQFRLDFAWPELGLVVEVDGWDCHSSPGARRHDLHRRNRIVLGDLKPLVYTYGDIVRRGDAVVAEIREAIGLCVQQLSPDDS